jgi:hypothetical protein
MVLLFLGSKKLQAIILILEEYKANPFKTLAEQPRADLARFVVR